MNAELPVIGGISEASIDDCAILIIRGWVLSPRKADRVEIEIDGEVRGAARINMPRRDVHGQHPQYDDPNCGFQFGMHAEGLDGNEARGHAHVYHKGERIHSFELRFRAKPSAVEHVGEGYREDDTRPLVVVTTHIRFLPPVQGNRVVIVQLVEWLKRSGYRVFLVSQTTPWSVRDAIEDLTRMFDKVYVVEPPPYGREGGRRDLLPIDLYNQATAKCLLKIHEQYGIHAVIAQYVHMSSSMERLPPSVLRLVQTHDVLSRFGREVAPMGIEIEPFRRCTAAEEAEVLRYADVLIAIQDNEREILKRMVPDRKVLTVGLAAEDFFRLAPHAYNTQEVMYIGSKNPLNVQGLQAFIDNCWERVLARVPAARLKVYGPVCEGVDEAHRRKSPMRPGIDLMGVCDSLDEAFDRAKVFINCTSLGTGLKIKTIEALARGKALVTTPAGVEGIPPRDEAPFVVAEDWRAFADAVIDLLRDPLRRREVEESARRYARKYLTTDYVYRELAECLAAGAEAARTS